MCYYKQAGSCDSRGKLLGQLSEAGLCVASARQWGDCLAGRADTRPSCVSPTFQPQNDHDKQGPRGCRRTRSLVEARGGIPLSSRAAFTHLTQHVTQLLGFEMIYMCGVEISLKLTTLGFFILFLCVLRAKVRGRPLQSVSTKPTARGHEPPHGSTVS